ncbi:MAG TPA: hypothetical protein VNJ46_09470 [Gaiellaceae bacterium]|nr:hypothetical protein [Gaiellaceae bacterium]
MKHVLAALSALAAAAVLAAPLHAAPSGKGLESFPVICDGAAVTVTVSSGASFWIGEQHYVLTSFTGMFTPPGGGTPETFTRTYGAKTGLAGGALTCSATFEDPEGTFAVTVTAVAVPPA